MRSIIKILRGDEDNQIIPQDIDFYHMLLNKKNALFQQRNTIQNLALRGSHCAYAIRPEVFVHDTFNLGVTSQDLFGTYHMYKNIVGNLPNLKNVILFYAFFLNGYDLSKTQEQWRCYYYKYVFGIPYNVKKNKKIRKFFKKNFFRKTEKLIDYKGYTVPTYFGGWKADERCRGHLKNFYRNDDGLFFLHKISELANKHHHNLYIILPPYRSDYQNELPEDLSGTAIQKIKNVTNFNNVRICNFLDDDSFCWDDFVDTDHLSPEGAYKLSIKLNKIIDE